jgi:hypothetical protein
MKMECLVCGAEFVLDGWNICPHCGAVGDELMEVNEDDEGDPTDEEIAYLYEQCEARRVVCDEVALIGVQ